MTYDVYCNILSLSNVGYLENVSLAFSDKLSTEERNKGIHDRLNPFLYLHALTPKPRELMKLMRETKTILGGSRGAAYFYPKVSTKDSDWDFYCLNDSICVGLLLCYMEGIGCNFDYENKAKISSDEPYHFLTNFAAMLIGTIQADSQRPERKIQIIISTSVSNFDAFFEYDSTATQCIFTGFCAISLYHIISKDDKAVRWVTRHEIERRISLASSQNRDTSLPNLEMLNISDSSSSVLRYNDPECRMKRLKKRGMTFISYEDYHGLSTDIAMPHAEDGKIRSIEDKASYIQSFDAYGIDSSEYKKYTKYMIWKDRLDECTRIYINMYKKYEPHYNMTEDRKTFIMKIKDILKFSGLTKELREALIKIEEKMQVLLYPRQTIIDPGTLWIIQNIRIRSYFLQHSYYPF